tara:strand:+ start:1802 stop:2224 length:423 start_codon:yes stop_codon:yes gene_type:complete
MSKVSDQLLKEVLKKEGLRYTQQRKKIWNEIQDSSDHRDAEDIYLSLRNNSVNVSRATVYRTIDIFVKNRLVRKMDVGDGRSRFEARLDDDHHDHMICIKTGKIIEFYNDELELLQEKIVKDHGYKLVRHVHQLFVEPIK